MKRANLGADSLKTEFKPLSVAMNPDRPILYVTSFDKEAVVFDPQHDRLLKLNSTAIEMWKLVSSGHPETQVVEVMAGQYGVDRARVAKDLEALLCKITEHRLAVDSYLLTGHTDKEAQEAPLQPNFPWYAQESQRQCRPKRFLTLRAFLGLALFDVVLRLGSLQTLGTWVHAWPVKQRPLADRVVLLSEVCAAVDRACVWYPRKARCLQRSAITACLLRSKGVAARLVIGARPVPLLVHAWVEADGGVVNDFPLVRNFYQPMVSY